MSNASDTTYDIWERVWRCLVSQNQTTSEAYYKLFGRPSSGYKSIDSQCKDQYVDTVLTIDKMVEYFKAGVSIQVVKYEDTEQIYQIIERHLQAWANMLNHGVNIGDAPIEDLIAMDQFAHAVYDKAKYIIKNEVATSVFMQKLTSFTSLSKATIMSDLRPVDMTRESEEAKYPEREDLSKIFKNNVVGFGRWK